VSGWDGWRAEECFSFLCGHSRNPQSCWGWIETGYVTGRSAAPSLKSSACTSVRPQTHEPGEKQQNGALNTHGGGVGAERGEQNVE